MPGTINYLAAKKKLIDRQNKKLRKCAKSWSGWSNFSLM